MRMLAFFIGLFVCVSGTVRATESAEREYREFTDVEGRTIRASITRATREEVWIRREDGAEFRLGIERFSERDRKFIKEWRLLDAMQRPRSIEVSARQYSEDRVIRNRPSMRIRNESAGYEVTVRNNMPDAVEDLRVEYRLFFRKGTTDDPIGVSREMRRARGDDWVEKILPRDEVSFKTQTVTLETRERPSTYTGRLPRRVTDDLAGIWLRFYKDDRQVFEFAHPASLAEREEW